MPLKTFQTYAELGSALVKVKVKVCFRVWMLYLLIKPVCSGLIEQGKVELKLQPVSFQSDPIHSTSSINY
jgi:hypothetical protein